MARLFTPPQLIPILNTLRVFIKVMTWSSDMFSLNVNENILVDPVKSRFQILWPGQEGSAGWKTSPTCGCLVSQFAISKVAPSSASRRTANV